MDETSPTPFVLLMIFGFLIGCAGHLYKSPATVAVGIAIAFLATAAAYGAGRGDGRLVTIVVDNASYGTIRMHQERDYPGRVSGTSLVNPDFAALARAYGAYAETVETTEEFAPALRRAVREPGVKLLHLKTDVEQITTTTTLTKVRARRR